MSYKYQTTSSTILPVEEKADMYILSTTNLLELLKFFFSPSSGIQSDDKSIMGIDNVKKLSKKTLSLTNIIATLSTTKNIKSYTPIGSTFGSIKEVVSLGDKKLSFESKIILNPNETSSNIIINTGNILNVVNQFLGINIPSTYLKVTNELLTTTFLNELSILEKSNFIALDLPYVNTSYFKDNKIENNITFWIIENYSIEQESYNVIKFSGELLYVPLITLSTNPFIESLNN